MPIRAPSHILEEESVRRFKEALAPYWLYRTKNPDYGIDGEVEIFNADGSSTGLSFNVQLRATSNPARANLVRLEVDELEYYCSLDAPTAVVRYSSADGSLFWQWASNIASHVKIAEGQRTVTYHFNERQRWAEKTPDEIRRTLEVRRHLASHPPSKAVPLRVNLSAIAASDRYSVNRAIARAIADSRGALTAASNNFAEVEAFACLEPTFLSIGIDTITGVTFDLRDPTPDDYVAAILYALVRLFRRQRLIRHAEALGIVLAERRLTHHNQELAFEACMSLARELPALVQLAIANGFHEQNEFQPLIAMMIAKAPDREASRASMETFFEATLAAARKDEPASEAAAHYSIGNFYRSQRYPARAAHHYNRARHLRPAYLLAEYFLREFAGVLFVGGRYSSAQRLYREAVRVSPNDADLIFLFGDALLLSGAVAEARSCFREALARCATPRLLREAELKVMLCDCFIEATGSNVVPRRAAEATVMLRGRYDDVEHLEDVLRRVDALHPLARFNLGVARSRENHTWVALQHFLSCAITQPHDIAAWANAAICALGLSDEVLLLRVMSTAIHHMGADAYDHFRDDISQQGMPAEKLALLDEIAMHLLEESESEKNDGFTLRMLDGDSYETMTILGSGSA